MIRIERLDPASPLVAQEVDLRNRELLHEVGLDVERFNEEFPLFERKAERWVAVLDHPSGERVVGCVGLIPHHPRPGTGQLMQMAVDAQLRGEGVGRRLVAALETRAFGELGLGELFCHARRPAVTFYERLGWATQGEPFDEVGIEHVRMTLRDA